MKAQEISGMLEKAFLHSEEKTDKPLDFALSLSPFEIGSEL